VLEYLLPFNFFLKGTLSCFLCLILKKHAIKIKINTKLEVITKTIPAMLGSSCTDVIFEEDDGAKSDGVAIDGVVNEPRNEIPSDSSMIMGEGVGWKLVTLKLVFELVPLIG